MSTTRRNFLKLAALAGASVAVTAGEPAFGAARAEDGELVRVDAFKGVLDALDRYPLVGIGDMHLNEQCAAYLTSLVQTPGVKHTVNDIVVECGNGFYQDLSDRFFLDLEPVGDAELATMWRTTIGGRVYWDAPIYEQLYRTVRAVNESLPEAERIRMILGDAAVDWSQIHSAADADKIPAGDQRETYYADVVEREVLAKGRRAILFCGGDHLKRGIRTTPGGLVPPKNPDQPSAGTILTENHPGALYVAAVPFTLVGSDIQSLPRGVPETVESTLSSWPAPSLAPLAGTWLGSEPMPFRAIDPDSTFQEQTDALIWLGSDDALTCSRADPAIYQSGDYADELRRRSEILSEITGTTIDLVAEGLHLAGLGPSCATR